MHKYILLLNMKSTKNKSNGRTNMNDGNKCKDREKRTINNNSNDLTKSIGESENRIKAWKSFRIIHIAYVHFWFVETNNSNPHFELNDSIIKRYFLFTLCFDTKPTGLYWTSKCDKVLFQENLYSFSVLKCFSFIINRTGLVLICIAIRYSFALSDLRKQLENWKTGTIILTKGFITLGN